MKILLTYDLAAEASAAKEKIDQYFDSFFSPHRAEAHRRKREIAQSVLDGGSVGTSASFAEEAARNGMTEMAFAEMILSKEDDFDAAEQRRRVLVEAVRAAKSKAEIDQVLVTLRAHGGMNGIR